MSVRHRTGEGARIWWIGRWNCGRQRTRQSSRPGKAGKTLRCPGARIGCAVNMLEETLKPRVTPPARADREQSGERLNQSFTSIRRYRTDLRDSPGTQIKGVRLLSPKNETCPLTVRAARQSRHDQYALRQARPPCVSTFVRTAGQPENFQSLRLYLVRRGITTAITAATHSFGPE